MKKHYYLLLPLAFCLLMASCKQETDPVVPAAGTTATEADEQPAAGNPSGTLEQEKADAILEQPTTRPAARPQAKAKTTAAPAKRAAAPAQPKGKAETLYVETYGAQGKVWGHVTLNGDRGTGTIHDFDENTLSVTVTRHGNELFAVDQNSRQYVFKLKK